MKLKPKQCNSALIAKAFSLYQVNSEFNLIDNKHIEMLDNQLMSHDPLLQIQYNYFIQSIFPKLKINE